MIPTGETPSPADVTGDPWVLRTVVIVTIIGIILTALKKGSSQLGAWLDDRRRAADAREAEEESARVKKLEADVEWLKARDAEKDAQIAGLESWRSGVVNRWGDHMVWDARAHALVSIHAPEDQAARLGAPPSILPDA